MPTIFPSSASATRTRKCGSVRVFRYVLAKEIGSG